jgi:SpoVK/Ycf46/Vps4 family AAA+-type ATPase
MEVFKIQCKGLPIGEGIDYAELGRLTDNYSSADIGLVCEEAAKIPWKESVQTGKTRTVSMDDFRKVVSERKSSIISWFKQADKQLQKSGERELYPELDEAVAKFKAASPSESVSAGNDALLREKRELEFMLQETKSKYTLGEIDEPTFKDLYKEYNKRIIELDAKIRFQSERK